MIKTNGWAIGNAEEYDNHEYQDMVESKALYDTLEKEIIPLFYDRSTENDIPREWIKIMKRSMTTLCPEFHSHRMLEDYMIKFYHQAAEKYIEFSKNEFAQLKDTVKWQNNIVANWDTINIIDIKHDKLLDKKVNTELNIEVVVKMSDSINPQDIDIDAYVGQVDQLGNFLNRNIFSLEYAEEKDGLKIYRGSIRCQETGKFGFLIRVLPDQAKVFSKYDLNKIIFV